MEAMLQLSERDETTNQQPESGSGRGRGFLGPLQPESTRRVLLLTALGA